MKGVIVWYEPEDGVRFRGIILGQPFRAGRDLTSDALADHVAISGLSPRYTDLVQPGWASSRQAAPGTLRQTCPAAPVAQLRMEDGSRLKVVDGELRPMSSAEVAPTGVVI